MQKEILYLGDTSIKEQASYLAGVMTHYKLGFDYLPSDAPFKTELLGNHYKAVIISDYPVANFTADQLDKLSKIVLAGTGLLMIGGWGSFTGERLEYTHTILKNVLPVIMQSADDRVNYSQTCLVEKSLAHEIVANLPFETFPPAIGGFNRITAKPDSQTLLLARRFSIEYIEGLFRFQPIPAADPLLVIGQFGSGRVAAYASDAAPHWVGPFVDWGDSRVMATGPNSSQVEVGNWYAQFFHNLIKWTSRI